MTVPDDIGLTPLKIARETTYLTPFPLSPLFHMLLLSLSRQRQGPKTKTKHQDSYDYIIVGGGAAGSVLASRLSELSCVNVLLLEAGKTPPILSDVPVVAGSFVNSDVDWKYRTTPQKHTGAALIGRKVVLPTGKVLGGGSTINALIANRGHRLNYDEWAALGATGWSYKDVFPYFVKLEDYLDPQYQRNGYHGVGGPVTISKQKYQPEAKLPIMKAAVSLGYPIIDVTAATMVGFWESRSILRDGQRCSTAKAYLVPVENRPNLDIITEAMVTKIIIDDRRRAVAVEVLYKGIKKVYATKEIILSAGAVNTAQLLMVSGIGPSSLLEKYHIPVIADLPVGKNLQEHCASFLAYEMGPQVVPLLKKLFKKEHVQTYIDTRSGPLVYTSGFNLLAFLSNNATGAAKDLPDHELYFLETPAIGAKLRIGLTGHAYLHVFGPYLEKPILVCMSQVLHPKSRGSVTIISPHAIIPPLVDPNYLADPQDVLDIVEGLKNCMKILSRPELQEVGLKIFSTTFPGCEKYQANPDPTLLLNCVARQAVMSLSHPVGTAKMGQPNDPTTVVDPKLRVKTIYGLRVVDASVMPTIIWGNTNIPTIMIAEKAADIIKKTISCVPYY